MIRFLAQSHALFVLPLHQYLVSLNQYLTSTLQGDGDWMELCNHTSQTRDLYPTYTKLLLLYILP